MHFTWDTKKADSNLKKHKISFEEAVTAFYDPVSKVVSDPDHSNDEERFLLIGHSRRENLLIVIHVYHESKDTIRIISARKTTKKKELIVKSYLKKMGAIL